MDGFLGTRGSLMLDLVAVGMGLTLPLMFISVSLARFGRRYSWHRAIQLTLALTLLAILLAFELEMRLEGWDHRAAPSPYWSDGRWNDPIDYSLAVHLCFAIPTPFVWGALVVRALRNFPRPPAPNEHSQWHRRMGRFGVFLMTATTLTGWLFYYLAFAAV